MQKIVIDTNVIVPLHYNKIKKMSDKQVCKVTKKQQVTVVIEDVIDTKAQKLEQLKGALNHPLFLADIKEVQNDFDAVDPETL